MRKEVYDVDVIRNNTNEYETRVPSSKGRHVSKPGSIFTSVISKEKNSAYETNNEKTYKEDVCWYHFTV